MNRDEQEIRELVATWMSASKTGDIDMVLSLIAEDAVFLVPGHAPMHKADFAAASGRPGPDAPQFDGSVGIQEIRIMGEWAFMWSQLAVVMTPPGGGPSIKRAGHTLTILKKNQGRWLLARDANMLVTLPD
jgi:uncharacterized protein (TIGR02246 family)